MSRRRRYSALSGAVALGAFLVLHLGANASALFGQETYDAVAGSFQRSILLPLFEIFVVYVPLAYHTGYSLWLTWTKKPSSVDDPPEAEKKQKLLLRVSGMLVLVFVLAHFWEFRAQRWFFGMSSRAFYPKLAEHLSWTWVGVPWIAIGYLLGLAVTIFHFAYGLAQSAVTWRGMEPKRATVATAVLGGALFLAGTATIVGLATGTRLPSSLEKGNSCGPASSNH